MEELVTSAGTPPKPNLLGEEREGLILGYQRVHSLCLLHSHVASYAEAYENSGCSDMTSCPSGNPIGEICSFSHLAEFPGTRAGNPSSWSLVDPHSTKLVDTGPAGSPCPLLASSNRKSFFRSALQTSHCRNKVSLEKELSVLL